MGTVSERLFLMLFAWTFAVCLGISSAKAFYRHGTNARAQCSNVTPCGWALCRWTRKPSVPYPDENNCVIVPNDACKCPADNRCTLTDIMDPPLRGGPLRYEYRCVEPELARQVYEVGRRNEPEAFLRNLQ